MLTGLKYDKEEARKDTDVIISVGNIWSNIVCPKFVLDRISSAFSYEDPNAAKRRANRIDFYVERNEMKKAQWWSDWDGRWSVFNRTKFGTGLLEDVLMWLEDKGYTVEVRNKMRVQADVEIQPMKDIYELRDEQQEAMDVLAKRDYRGLIHATMAYGKTVLGIRVIHTLQKATVIISDRKKITEQWRDDINKSFKLEEREIPGTSGYFYLSYRTQKPVIMICSTRLINNAHDVSANPTLRKRNQRIADFCKSAGLLIFDEVHHAAADGASAAVSRVPAYYRIGLSGTIGMREDNKDYEYFGTIGTPVYYFSATDLVNLGRGKKAVIKPVVVHYSRKYLASVRTLRDNWQELYEVYIMENQKRNNKITSIIIDEALKGSHILVLIDRVDHAKMLASKLGEGIAVWVDSEEKDEVRKQKFQDFTSGLVPCMICTYSLAGEGFDYPELNVLVLAMGKAETRIRQSIGRVMRKSVHDVAHVYDFVDPIKPFRDHFVERLLIYEKEPAFELEERGKTMPYWARSYMR